MGRYVMTVGAVTADALISAITFVGQISPAALCLTLLTTGFGVVLAANEIADGIMSANDESPS
ncbi:MAG: hypothetical protein M3552_08815 [Planctomycetota bacterium]|nr:hypothetical protein [Planctomycetaceae bacterium]MDQ3330742.1 hypothetical protein [Planctomycetota bacterium]